jgi:hypothetical protein
VSIFIESRYKVIWRSKVEIDYTVWSILSHNLLRVNAKTRSSVATLIKSKRDEVTTIILCKLKLKKYILYLTLSICMLFYQEGCYIDCQQSLMLNKSLNTQVRWVKYNGHTHSTSHWTRKKIDGPVSQTGGSGLGRWAPTVSFQIPDAGCFSFPKPDVSVFTG